MTQTTEPLPSNPEDLRQKAKKAYEDNLAELDRQKKELKQAYRSELAKISEAERKLDARRKIILGGALMEQSASDPLIHAALSRLLQSLSRDQDKSAFVDWSIPPKPGD